MQVNEHLNIFGGIAALIVFAFVLGKNVGEARRPSMLADKLLMAVSDGRTYQIRRRPDGMIEVGVVMEKR